MPALTIPARFCGPPGSGNGGYVCGRIAAYLEGQVTVTLRRPAPLATPLAVERGGDSSSASATAAPDSRGSLLAGQPGAGDTGPGLNGGSSHGGRPRALLRRSGLPCLLCLRDGPPARGRAADLPRTVAGRPLWAAPWTPDPSVTDASGRVRPEVLWGGAGLSQRDRRGRGRRPGPGHCDPARPDDGQPGGAARGRQQYRVIAWPGERDGRKLTAGSALLGPGGQVLAAARTVWLTVPRPVLAPAAEGAS